MKYLKIALILLAFLMVLAGCGNTPPGTVPERPVSKDIDFTAEVDAETMDIDYRFTAPESYDDASVIIRVYRLTRNSVPNLWGEAHVVKLEQENHIKAYTAAYTETDYYDLTFDGGTYGYMNDGIMLRVNGVPIRETTNGISGKVVAFCSYFITEPFTGATEKEIVLGYFYCSENRELIRSFDSRYFYDSGSIPASDYWYDLFAVTVTVTSE